jgi:hypothetical protein
MVEVRGMRKSTPLKVTLAGLLASALAARAQPVIMPAPSYPVTPPAAQESQTNNEMTVFSAEENVPGGAPETKPFQYGIFNLRPHPFYRFLYGTGILSSTNQAQNTIINQLSPGFLLEIGRQWTLDYTPTWTFYSNNHFHDSLDHAVTLTGGTAYEDWTFGLSQGFTLTSDPLVETATQTSQETYATVLNASYEFNDKMSADLGLSQNIISADQFSSSREWSTLDWLNYEFWPRLNAGIGAGFGYDNVQPGSGMTNSPDMIYEQLQGRVNWRATDKISFQVNAGGEESQFLSGSAGDLLNFVCGAAIQYQPFEVTRITISVDRNVSLSYYANQTTENTDFTGELNQRLLGKLYLDLQGGYHIAKYVASVNTTPPVSSREDDYYSVSVQLSYPFAKRGSIAAFYQYSNDSSTLAGFSYSSSQVGFQISFSY